MTRDSPVHLAVGTALKLGRDKCSGHSEQVERWPQVEFAFCWQPLFCFSRMYSPDPLLDIHPLYFFRPLAKKHW